MPASQPHINTLTTRTAHALPMWVPFLVPREDFHTLHETLEGKLYFLLRSSFILAPRLLRLAIPIIYSSQVPPYLVSLPPLEFLVWNFYFLVWGSYLFCHMQYYAFVHIFIFPSLLLEHRGNLAHPAPSAPIGYGAVLIPTVSREALAPQALSSKLLK